MAHLWVEYAINVPKHVKFSVDQNKKGYYIASSTTQITQVAVEIALIDNYGE